jgi:pimeloyl-ACP methyl ester carboxylesterase
MTTVHVASIALLAAVLSSVAAADAQTPAPAPPRGVQPGSITYEDVAYPHPVQYLTFATFGEDVRMAYMDVPPAAAANGRTVVLLHGFNFGGFYFEGLIEVLRRAGYRVVVPDQVGFARSSKAIIPYTFADLARNTKRLLDHLQIARVSVIGHSMGGMLSVRFAAQYPAMVERLVVNNSIGVSDRRFDAPLPSLDERYKTALGATYQTNYTSISRYFAHDPKAWKPEFERFVVIRYARTLGGDFPRYARVEALLRQMLDLDPTVYDWPHIQAPTLVIAGAEDSDPIASTKAAPYRDRLEALARSIPGGRGRVHLIPGVGHVPHLEAPESFNGPVLDFLEN